MQRKTIGTISALALLLAAAAATAGEVYEWKDANGVTHYTQTPPPSGDYREHDERDVARPAPAGASAAPSTTAASATASASTAAGTESAQCVTARKNLALLQGEAAVQLDSDGDGKPDKTLDDTERANQLELARATLKAANCPA